MTDSIPKRGPRSFRDEWLKSITDPAGTRPERRGKFLTTSGIEVGPLYTANPDFEADSKLGYPGFFPYTRGIYPNQYRGRLWTMRQYAGFGSAQESNARYKYLLAQGTTGLSVAFDLPTQIGYDSDDPAARGEVGRVGVAICSIEDMRALFDGIPQDTVSTSMTINATAAILMALYIAVANERGIASHRLAGTVQNDILKEYIARGTFIYPPRASMRLVTNVISYCSANLPRWNPISISGYHIREAGSTAVQELAFTFANAIQYVDAARNAGLAVDEFAPRLAFFWGCHNNLFEEVAKFRAARRIWAHIIKNRYGASNPDSMLLRFHTQTAGCTLTAQQPLNNAVRVTVQALAAVLGGTQSLHTNALDEALSLPSAESARLALRTQQIIAHESGVADTVDPVGGSYFVEALTDEIERLTLEYLGVIESKGGAVAAIETHYFQDEIAREAYRYQTEIESEERIVVGVNQFTDDDDSAINVQSVSPALEEEQRQRLADLRRRRHTVKVSAALDRIRQAARTEENLIPSMIAAVESLATVGEISNVLREAWGEYRPGE